MSFTKENSVAVGKIPSGIFIVAAGDDQQRDGFLASWVQQVSFEPLLISLAVKPGRPCYDAINRGDVFAVNIIAADNVGITKSFWGGHKPGVDPFEGLATAAGENGGVVLSDALAVLECRMQSSSTPGDHEVVIAEVLSATMLNEGEPKAHVRKNGLEY